jgi:hypothetical protein
MRATSLKMAIWERLAPISSCRLVAIAVRMRSSSTGERSEICYSASLVRHLRNRMRSYDVIPEILELLKRCGPMRTVAVKDEMVKIADQKKLVYSDPVSGVQHRSIRRDGHRSERCRVGISGGILESSRVVECDYIRLSYVRRGGVRAEDDWVVTVKRYRECVSQSIGGVLARSPMASLRTPRQHPLLRPWPWCRTGCLRCRSPGWRPAARRRSR